MQRRPKVTIGFCVRNCEATVKEALVSIVNQDYPHELIEVIVVDGKSSDKTMQIVKEILGSSDIEAKFFIENKGLGFARQIVVDNATGDYILWVDGDMVLAQDHISKQVEFMENNPKVGIAGGRFQQYPGENLIATLESIEWVVLDYIYGGSTSRRPILHRAGGCIYRVEAIRQIGGFDTHIKGALEDLDVEYRMGDFGWLTYFVTDAVFYDRRKGTWKDLWKENFWYGYGGHYFMHKHGRNRRFSMFSEGFKRTVVAYRLTRRKIVFLFPVQYIFKKIAWLFGFLRAHIDGYGHNI
ncbi:MAG: glycosyltransferase, partial [Candidatus Bathyarchaeia archaeon]